MIKMYSKMRLKTSIEQFFEIIKQKGQIYKIFKAKSTQSRGAKYNKYSTGAEFLSTVEKTSLLRDIAEAAGTQLPLLSYVPRSSVAQAEGTQLP